MQPTKQEQEFIKANKQILLDIFSKRIEELKEEMVLEKDPDERDKIRELIMEFKRWLVDIKILTADKKIKQDTGI
jgi:hypothetical protein